MLEGVRIIEVEGLGPGPFCGMLLADLGADVIVVHRPDGSMAPGAPTTAGMRCSRARIAAWQVRPPRSVTIAAARFMIGSQSGFVVSATKTSPSANWANSDGSRITHTRPAPMRAPTAPPSTRTLLFSFR